MQTFSGFLLSSIKYGDNDAVVHCFTKEIGFETFFVKGLYAKKNKKKPYLFPLNELFFTVSQSRSGNMQSIQKIEKFISFDFVDDFKANSIVFFLAEFFNSILRNEEASVQIYNQFLELKNELNNKNYQCHFDFLVQFLSYQGCSPLVEGGNFLNADEGCFSIHQENRLFTEEISSIWKQLLISENSYQIKIPSHLRKEMLESIVRYYDIHVPHFKVPDSLEVLQQIFE